MSNVYLLIFFSEMDRKGVFDSYSIIQENPTYSNANLKVGLSLDEIREIVRVLSLSVKLNILM